MTFGAVRSLRSAGVLGMNARNADFVMRYNSRRLFPLVDDKLRTKALAAEHCIPTPHLYHVVRYHGDLTGLQKDLGELRRFAVKPTRGSGGSGIVLVTDRTDKGFVNQNGEHISWSDLIQHLNDILSGVFSLSGLEDRAMFETLIHPSPVFSAVTYEGVPDIRVIIYSGVPAMAMVRLPTAASDGKSNLHRGAVGAGIDLAAGATLMAVQYANVVTHHPDTGNPVKGIAIPYWQEILTIAASLYEMTGLGYLGVDLVIDRTAGPLLLEVNARPGLAIQIANQVGLRSRFEQIDRAPRLAFATPESRVAWAMAELGHR